jgi:serine/threonine-protein kinase
LKANLNIGTTDFTFNDSVPNGIVFRQYPTAGTKMSTATKVNLTISQGPLVGRVPVPDLTKLSLPAAITKLNEVKLTVGNVTFQSSPDAIPNSVLDQYPHPGELANENSAVDLFIARENSETPLAH